DLNAFDNSLALTYRSLLICKLMEATTILTQGETYNVILGFSDLKNQNVLPGMSINVTPEANSTDAMQISLPLSAISPDNMGKKYVWLVDMDSKVTKKMVETGTLLGDRIIITSGLQPQDKVVIAGVNSLKEGDMVRPLDSEGAK
ncbi:MAG: efflux RND transporter periplasmic adaptor subunit, partial [Shewanella oncorhynchi]